MEKFNSYETLFIIDASLSEEAIKGLVDKFTALIAEHGKVSDVNEWGKRRLAYPINDKEEGYYVLVNFESEGNLPAELERIFGITDGIMRSIVIRHEDKKAAAQA
ncbi:MAG: 30S ribosomal protein S6 [Clostridia bacterium]|jgi:small subunit ribosomal protein S6|nr:30S ribosomal protein S6 [Clostridia bacterium]MBQ5887428.1 30S ribosomal protein S6 [Clostridia bacterium]